jgi:hypothetical protein
MNYNHLQHLIRIYGVFQSYYKSYSIYKIDPRFKICTKIFTKFYQDIKNVIALIALLEILSYVISHFATSCHLQSN